MLRVSQWHCFFLFTLKQYNLVPAKGRRCSLAGKVTAGLAESNDSLSKPHPLATCPRPPSSKYLAPPRPGFMTMSPAGRLPRDRDQLRTLRSLIRVWEYFLQTAVWKVGYDAPDSKNGAARPLCLSCSRNRMFVHYSNLISCYLLSLRCQSVLTLYLWYTCNAVKNLVVLKIPFLPISSPYHSPFLSHPSLTQVSLNRAKKTGIVWRGRVFQGGYAFPQFY